jgi:hypothetical protein
MLKVQFTTLSQLFFALTVPAPGALFPSGNTTVQFIIWQSLSASWSGKDAKMQKSVRWKKPMGAKWHHDWVHMIRTND